MKQEKAMNILLLILCGFIFVVNGESIFLYNQTYNRHTYVLPLRSYMNQWGTVTHDPLRNNFSAAQHWCTSHFNGSKLATIKSEAIQRNISQFVSGAIYSLRLSNLVYVRVGGKSYHEWRWVNGKILSGDLAPVSSASSYGALMGTNKRFEGRNQDQRKSYICQNSEIHEGYVVRSDSADWNGARSNCIREGGDLASFDNFNNTQTFDAFVRRLSLTRTWEYWVGLQKHAIWRWDDADSEMNYTNWLDDRTPTTTNQCSVLYFSINPSEQTGKWAAFPCGHQIPFICEIIDTREPTTVATTESVTSSTAPETTTPVATTTKTTTVAVAQTSRQNPQETDKIQLSITEPIGRHPTSSATLSSTAVALSIAVGVCATIAIAIAFLLIVTIKKHRTRRSNGTSFPTVADNEHSSAAAAAAAAAALPSQTGSKQTAGSNTNHNNKQRINATDKNSANLNAASTRRNTNGENQQQKQQQQSTIYASVQDTRGGNSPPPGKGNETTSAAAADKGKLVYAEVGFNRPSNK